MTGYVRQDVSGEISPNVEVKAEPLNSEFDALQAAFSSASGHSHNGQVGEGPPITVLGPTQDVSFSSSSISPRVNNTVSLGTTTFRFRDLFLSGSANFSSLVTSTATITGGSITGITDLAIADGGTGASTASQARTNLGLGGMATQNSTAISVSGGNINNVAIGATTPSTGRFTTVEATDFTGDLTGNVTGNLSGTVTGNLIGNASTATRWASSRSITLTGGATGTVSFNGSAGVTMPVTVSPTGHVHTVSQISGIGNMASQSSSSVTITGGLITGITDLAVADGGTGASTPADARANLGLGYLSTVSTISNDDWSGAALTVLNGGTGATTVPQARSNLGLGTLATMSSIALDSSYLTGSLPVNKGGTGSTTAAAARTALGAASTAVATTGANGLMSADDKAKLNDIQSGATNNTSTTQATWTEGTATTNHVIAPLALQTKLQNFRNANDLGWGQQWQDMSASRVIGTSYRNTSGSPIQVSVSYGSASGTHLFQVSNDNTNWVTTCSTTASTNLSRGSSVIPHNHWYRIVGTGTVADYIWAELRSV